MLNLIKSRKNKEGGSKGNKRSGSKSEKTGRTRNEKNRNAVGKGSNITSSTTATNSIPSSESNNSSTVLNDPTVQQLYQHYYSIAEGGGPSLAKEKVDEHLHIVESESHLLSTRSTHTGEENKFVRYSGETPSEPNISSFIHETKDQPVSIPNKVSSVGEVGNTGDIKVVDGNKSTHRAEGKSVDKNSNIMQDPVERPSSRTSLVGVGKRTNQPKLGTGGSSTGNKNWAQHQHNTYLFEDDPGIMSEVETSSTRFRRTSSNSKDSKHAMSTNNSGTSPISRSQVIGGIRHPRTTSNQYTPVASQNYPLTYLSPNPGMFTDDDPGIMSEAETASTTRGGSKRSSGSTGGGSNHRSRVSIPSMGSHMSINKQQTVPAPVTRTVQFRYPIVSDQYPGSHGHPGAGNLFEDDDPGIMSEAETSSTPGRRRLRGTGNGHVIAEMQQRMQQIVKNDSDVLPVVRTPSKTLERPLGIVFLIYRGETKRALLPNEITSIFTVKALFVRSFGSMPIRLTMEYMDTPRVKIYIHDGSKDTFYEIKDLTEIRDKSILKLFEADSSGRGPAGLGPAGLPPITNIGDEEILAAVGGAGADSSPIPPQVAPEAEYVDSRSVRALKIFNRNNKQDPSSYVIGARPSSALSNTLPRNAFSTLADADPSRCSTSLGMEQSNLMSQNPPGVGPVLMQHQQLLPTGGRLGERSKTLGPGFLRSGTEGSIIYNRIGGNQNILDSYYVSGLEGDTTYNTQDHTNSYGHQQHRQIRSRFSNVQESNRYYTGPGSTEEAKERMMNMESQLSQLTGMVEKALKHKKLASGKKTVSFDKAVSFSDDKPQDKAQPQGILRQQKHERRSSDIGGTRDHHHHHHVQPSTKPSVVASSSPTPRMMSPELYNQLRGLQRSARDLRQEVKVLRRLTQLQSMAMKDLVQDTYLKLRDACISFSTSQQPGVDALNGGPGSMSAADLEQWRLAQDEEIFSRELNELVQAISQLEAKVEEMRSGVINKKNKIGLTDVENMALILSKSTKTVTQLKQVFPTLETNLRGSTVFQASTSASSKGKPAAVLLTEEFLRRTPERLENVWKRCKKLTGTLVTLKRLASVQEQRFHPGSSAIVDVNVSLSPTPPIDVGRINNIGAGGSGSNQNSLRSSSSSTSSSSLSTSTQGSTNLQLIGDRLMTDPKEGTLDDLLDALQNYSTPSINPSSGSKKLSDSKQNTNNSASVPKVAPSISIDKDNHSLSPQKKGMSITSTGKPLKGSAGSNLESQMQTKEQTISGSNVIKGKGITEDTKIPTPCPPPRGSITVTTNGPVHNDASSPSIKLSGGSSCSTKTAPPPPPPRTSSTHPVILGGALESNNNGGHVHGIVRKMSSKINNINNCGKESGGDSSDFSESSESINSQEGHVYASYGHNARKLVTSNSLNENPPPIPNKPNDIHSLSGKLRQDALENRHQELLSRQKQLQEQYERLQHMAEQKKNDKSAASALLSNTTKNASNSVQNNSLRGASYSNVTSTKSSIPSTLGQTSISSSLASSSSLLLSRNGEKSNKNHMNQLSTNTSSITPSKPKDNLLNGKNNVGTKNTLIYTAPSISLLNNKKTSASPDSDRSGCNLGSSGNETEESSNPEEDSSETTPACNKAPVVNFSKSIDSAKSSVIYASVTNTKKKVPPALPARGNSVITTIPSSSPKNTAPIANPEKTDIEKIHVNNEESSETKNCDSEQPHCEDKNSREPSSVEVKDGVDPNVNSSDSLIATLKKSYETDMI